MLSPTRKIKTSFSLAMSHSSTAHKQMRHKKDDPKQKGQQNVSCVYSNSEAEFSKNQHSGEKF